jgi:hypothetical protein
MIHRYLVAGFILVFVAAGAAAAGDPPFELAASRNRLFGDTRGTLVVAEDGIAFRTPSVKNARHWRYADLKQVRILSQTRLQVATYEDRGRLHLGSHRSYDFRVTAIPPELVAYLLARIERPIVTAVMPPLADTPRFLAPVTRARTGRGSDGTLRLYDGGLAYATDRDGEARFWRFRDIFAVLALDAFRLQVLAYEGGSGETRAFTFDLKEPLPDGMYDALWQQVNRPDRRSHSVKTIGRDMEAMMNHRMAFAGILALTMATGGAQASATADPQHQHGAPAASADPMALHQKLMAEMRANSARLDELVARMNAASGEAKMTAMAEILTALVKERETMHTALMAMFPGDAMKNTQMSGEMKAMHAAMSPSVPKPAATAAAMPAPIDIVFRSKPDPPRSGENAALEVALKDEDGKPVTDATVTVTFYMAPMGSMPAMRSTAALKHDAGGVYRGPGQVTMAGRWEVTIAATRAGKEIANKKITITAR